jgi:ferredoxin
MPNPHDDQPELQAGDFAGGQAASPKAVAALEVRFVLSDVSAAWEEDRFDSVLDLAVELGIDISSGCRYGDCGTCLTQLVEGTVAYNHATGIDPDSGYCLPCSCRPLTSITLNA